MRTGGCVLILRPVLMLVLLIFVVKNGAKFSFSSFFRKTLSVLENKLPTLRTVVPSNFPLKRGSSSLSRSLKLFHLLSTSYGVTAARCPLVVPPLSHTLT